jgi:pimeloyl-ACP methyl ester carboxylesterase
MLTHRGLTAVVHVGAEAHVEPALAVVLVHGVGSSSRAFDPVRDELGRLPPRLRTAVHAVDLPGFGASPRTRRDVPVEEHAALVAAYVREHVLRAGVGAAPPRVVLVGHSMGAQVVGQAMADHPDAAPAGVLVGPTADRRARTAPRQALRLARDAFGERPRALGTLAVDTVLRSTPAHYARQVRRMLDHRLEDVLPRVPGTVVVLRGADDPVAPRAWTRELALAAPRGEVREARGRHHIMDTDASAVVRAVLDAAQVPR